MLTNLPNSIPFKTLAGASLLLCSVTLVACKSGQTTAPDTVEPVATYTPEKGEKVREVNLRQPREHFERGDDVRIKQRPALPEATRIALMESLGCAEELVREEGCLICPTIDTTQPMAPPVRSGPVTPFVFEVGKFYKRDNEQILARIGPCLDADGNENVSQLVVLEKQGDADASLAASWNVVASTTMSDVTDCEPFNAGPMLTHTVCRVRYSKDGLTYDRHESVVWHDAPQPQAQAQYLKPASFPLIETIQGYGCTDNWAIEQRVLRKGQDIDNDGVEELVFDVTTEETMYVGPLDECMEGEFEGPLSPQREANIIETRYVYEPTEAGFTEQQQKSYMTPLSEEYKKLVSSKKP